MMRVSSDAMPVMTMMIGRTEMELHIDGFVEFIFDQPSDRTICHNSWGDCAVGDYVESQGGSRFDDCDRGDAMYNAFSYANGDYSQLGAALYDALNTAGATDLLDTYGDLKFFINVYTGG